MLLTYYQIYLDILSIDKIIYWDIFIRNRLLEIY